MYGHYVYTKTLKSSSWSGHIPPTGFFQQELRIATITDDVFIKWDLSSNHSYAQYKALALGKVEAEARIDEYFGGGVMTFTYHGDTSPDVDIPVTIIVEKAKVPETPNYLTLTAIQPNSTFAIVEGSCPHSYPGGWFEYSINGTEWIKVVQDEVVTLPNYGDFVSFRSTDEDAYTLDWSLVSFRFVLTGMFQGSGNCLTLLSHNMEIKRYSSYWSPFNGLFKNCTALLTAPEVPAIPHEDCGCGFYESMFEGCTYLMTLPKLNNNSLLDSEYKNMFKGCTSIELHETSGMGFTEYKIPFKGTGTISGTDALTDMFADTSGTFTGTPEINKTYYTPNEVV